MTFEIGTRVRVNFTATVKKTLSGANATSEVLEEGVGATHYVFLGSDMITGDKSVGGKISVKFDARLVGTYQDGDLITTKVRENNNPAETGGFAHFLYLDSPSVTVLEDEKPDTPSFKRGDRIKVKLDAAVNESTEDIYSTQGVSETGNGTAHFLYLDSPLVTRKFEKVQAEFEAEITGTPGAGRLKTTQVREIDESGRPYGYTHFIYLDSPSVAVPQGEKPEAEKKEEPSKPFKSFPRGTRIRVDITGAVNSDFIEEGTFGCTEVGQTESGAWTHYLYLNSTKVDTTKKLDASVRAVFDAVVTGTYLAGQNATTQVQEVIPYDSGVGEYTGFTHFLYLDSAAITVLPAKDSEPDKPVAPKPVIESVTARITSAAAVIESADVLKRIQELEDRRTTAFDIIRDRTGEKLETRLATAAAALEYLEEQDYNPVRFTIVSADVMVEADQEELSRLRRLNDAGRAAFGSSQWITFSVQLRNEDEFTEEWGRDKAMADLGISSYQLDEWPLDRIDWNDAVQELLDSQYTRIEFDGVVFWGKND